ncbi:hypothetical protein M3A76_10100 [Corynebacterium sanguinis]|uniref:Uncharacterized protein n=3 Tax=Corynebacterium TaxID=1716 RepID=C0XQJ9_CORLD|nr:MULTISPECIES: hypothetical protein [Corynebacterium]EEI17413.1 hypothetical protein HMPREF0298_0719 [Corynebacterium lipophiloflavum DSM 44291]MCT1584275.1 hypothetical protein [Corynebacterium sanguinis]MCT1613422.1 hypothetical protein [Corynebacterium sanguinis]MCT1883371.1 hypothetical protein [Corynebacterium sanguinis]MCT2022356.1 hypothetical protein [Corynebacterium sanguinis]
MTTYTTNVEVDVRNVDEAAATVNTSSAAAFVFEQLIQRAGTFGAISAAGDATGDTFPVKVEAANVNDADDRLNDTFRPRLVDGVDYAISWTLPRTATGGFFD